MPLAKTVVTTSAPGARSSRRSLFGGAALVLTASAVGISPSLVVEAAGSVPPPTDTDLIALCVRAEATDDHSSAVMDAISDMVPSDSRWSPAIDKSARIFAECRQDMNQAAKIPAATLNGLRAKASLALREMTPSDFDDCPLVLSVLTQLAGRA